MNVLIKICSACVLWALALQTAHAALPRFPQPYADRIVFVANGSIWSVPKNGGTATRLTGTPGQTLFPRVSPDGKWIAYTEASNVGTDIWVIPSTGGAARRLTFHPAMLPRTGDRGGPDNMVVTWTPDSQWVVYLSRRDQWNHPAQDLYKVSLAGGLPQHLPIDGSVGLATFAPDGRTIAYNRFFTNFRTWKRYNGGLAQQVFTYDLSTHALEQITDWSGTNTAPMWYGRKIYYLADRDSNRRANLWVYDLDSRQHRQVTHLTDFDIDFPALGGDAIAFQQGGKLYLLELPSERLREVSVFVPDDEARARPRVVSVKDQLRDRDPAGKVNYAIAPNGRRALFSARGDIFSIAAEEGSSRNLTLTQAADEDHPTFSRDGEWVAYTTDAGGSQQVAIRPAQGGSEKVLTDFADGYFYRPVFAPDGKMLAFSDNAHRLWIVPTAGGKVRQVTQDPQSVVNDYEFSPDGRWLTYSLSANGRARDLHLYQIESAKETRLGEGDNIDQSPRFSPDGRYLWFLSNRHENAVPSDVEFDFAVLKSYGIYAIPLARETGSPLPLLTHEANDAPQAAVPAAPDRKGAAAPMRIDLEGLMARAVALPVDSGNIVQLDVRENVIVYLTEAFKLIEGELKGERSALRVFDLKRRQGRVAIEGIDSYALSEDGAKALVHKPDGFLVVPLGEGAAQPLDLSHMRALVDPRKEWAQMFDNAWRLQRDFFFSTAMNGQNWQAIHDRYAKLLPALGSREDLNYLIGQVFGELGNSHTYVGGGDHGDDTVSRRPALLGVDWALDGASGRYKVAKIYPGDNTREAYRSPLNQPGLAVETGDYVLAINGAELRAPDDPDRLLEACDASSPVELMVSDTPSGPRRRITVNPVATEMALREAAWVSTTRATVERLSAGKVGYLYLSDMGQLGMEQFIRQFYAQLGKQALVLDARWNGGGFIATSLLERLRRELVMIESNRLGATAPQLSEMQIGPKAMLLNEWSGSDGDIFPYLFKLHRLGPLVGMRSWGGVRGLRSTWILMDGGQITIPEAAPYTPDGKWSVENRGVEPDVEVQNLPKDLLAGHDMQLETAVSMMLKAIGNRPPGLPPRPPLLPAYPEAGIVPPAP